MMHLNNSINNKGFSLIELMVAIAIGLFLVAGVFTVYSNSRNSQSILDDQVQMVDNARFALDMIGADIRQSGVYGRVRPIVDGAGLVSNVDSSLIPAVPGECNAGWVVNVSSPVMAFDDSQANPYIGTCASNHVRGDILETRYSLLTAIADPSLQAGRFYLNSNVNRAVFFAGTASPNISATAGNYEYVANAYYIANFTDVVGDGIPSLHRVTIQNGAVVDQVLLAGVEDMQVQVGLDSDEDGSVDTYVNPVAGIDWGLAKSVQVWLVVRSMRNYSDLNTQLTATIAGTNVNFANDGFRRMVVSTVASMRN